MVMGCEMPLQENIVYDNLLKCSVFCIPLRLLTSGISVLVNHMERPAITVAIDGSLYKHHPHLHDMMMLWCAELAPQVKVICLTPECFGA